MCDGSDRFWRACRRECVDATPVWFMRQAGRYMKAYWTYRDRYRFLDMVKTPEISTAISPLRSIIDLFSWFASIRAAAALS